MFNIVIIGAGVIGLSIARAIGEKTNLSVLIIDKEDGIGRGISSRNSEVIHSGIYYDPKSLKTKYCTEGRDLLYDYCKKNNVWTNQCGKLIIADNYQRNELEALFDNGIKNGIPDLKIINKKEIESIELLEINYIENEAGFSNTLLGGQWIKSENGDHNINSFASVNFIFRG